MPEKKDYDVIILGTGPAGLQAAIHAARKKVSVLVLGKETQSSLFHAHVENFCCIFNITGEEMLNAGRQQAANFGADLLDEDVLNILPDGQRFKIISESGTELTCRSLIVATGTDRNKLGVPGEKEFLGRGVSYCVECDANFFKDEDVAVVGGASAAVGGALALLEYAGTVNLICETLDVADTLASELKKSNVVIYENAKIKEIRGDTGVKEIILQDGSKIPVAGVFIELGARGLMELAATLGIKLDDEMKYIETNKNMETSVPGVFAAGDICGPPWQMAKAVGEGCIAGIAAATYAKKLKKTK
jgi:thioredoxin reductase (NADPH)